MNTNVTQTEASLISNCLRGDRKYQKALYELYAPKQFAICLRYTKNQMDAEDVLQDGFVKLFNNLHKFKGEGSFEGWMRRIFVNTAIEHLRRRKIDTSGCEFLENSLSDKQPTALDNLYNKDLLSSSKTLSRGYQTVFQLYAVEGYSHQEIAKKLGITESTSKSQFSRAKAVLRTIVQGRPSRSLQEAV
ncbi:MAG: sigma-70 family polymerase sigma factor [Segetibacter sp.]|nr:sigma-70 family polymerase sigma factor [Segetibacter sp.]